MSTIYEFHDNLDDIHKEIGNNSIQLERYIFNGNVMRFNAGPNDMAAEVMGFIDPAHRDEVTAKLKADIESTIASAKAKEDEAAALRQGSSKMQTLLNRILVEAEEEEKRKKKEAEELEKKRQEELRLAEEERERKRQEEVRLAEAKELEMKRKEAENKKKKDEEEAAKRQEEARKVEAEKKRREDVRKSQEKTIAEVQQVVKSMIPQPQPQPFAAQDVMTEDEMEIENEVFIEGSNDFVAYAKQFTTAQKLFIIQSYGKSLTA
jgi:hypothetical protein